MSENLRVHLMQTRIASLSTRKVGAILVLCPSCRGASVSSLRWICFRSICHFATFLYKLLCFRKLRVADDRLQIFCLSPLVFPIMISCQAVQKMEWSLNCLFLPLEQTVQVIWKNFPVICLLWRNPVREVTDGCRRWQMLPSFATTQPRINTRLLEKRWQNDK